MNARLCAIRGCRELDAHADECGSYRCKGCRPRYVESGLVCVQDRAGLAETLADIGPLWRQLTKLPPTGVSSRGQFAKVSGSREAPVLLSLDLFDLRAPARHGSRGPYVRGVLGDPDQLGYLSVPTELDAWVRDWRDVRALGEHLPIPDVWTLVDWLEKRLPWACDSYEEIDGFTDALRELCRVMRWVLQLDSVTPERLKGVACRSCDRMALYRVDGLVSCGYCGVHYSVREYQTWVVRLADGVRRIAA